MWAYNVELYHHGILGQKWGIRRYQNSDGSLTRAGQRRLAKEETKTQKKDLKWIDKHGDKVYKSTYSKIRNEADNYLYKDLAEKYSGNVYTSRGKLNGSLVSDYNKRLAALMNQVVGDVPAPSGKVIRYVAKRRDVGVYTALADSGYDMDQVRNGVWNSGRIAYKKTAVDTA